MDIQGQKDNGRNYGIDLLRIVSMMLIPILHILGQGGVIDATDGSSAGYKIEWFLETAAYCSVNCYALISGYVGYRSKFRYSNILHITLQVIFYTLGITTVFAIFRPGSVGIKDFVKACIPFGFDAYWYYSAYFCMFFFIPYLNFLMERIEKGQATKLVILITVMFTILPTVFCRDLFAVNEGYSVLWITILYLVGAYIKKYGIDEKFHGGKCVLLYLACVVFAWGFNMVFNDKSFRLLFTGYTSPVIFAAAVFLLLFFARLNINNFWKRIIGFFAPASFGVYLLHVEPLVWNNVLYQRFTPYASLNPALLTLAIIGTALGIWLLGSLTDRIRIAVFRLLRIKKMCDKLEDCVKEKIRK